jgi:hypothetical protein
MDPTPTAQEAWVLAEMPGVAFPLEDDCGVVAAGGETIVAGSIGREMVAGSIFV